MVGSVYRGLIRTLKEAGCVFVRQGKGSHEIWHSPLTGRHFVVPFDVQKAPTVRAILRQAGIARRD